MNKVVFVREIDDLGRIVIPREYRNRLFDDNAKLEARLDTIVDVKNDLLSRLSERE